MIDATGKQAVNPVVNSWNQRALRAWPNGPGHKPAYDSSTWMTALPLYVPQFKQV